MINTFKGPHFFLSNFFTPAPVVLDGERYATTEHAYQAAKTLDQEERAAIRHASTAGQAKKLGKRVTLRSDWASVKDEVMLDLCRQKFREPELRKLLLDTGEQELVEGNYWNDVYWGVCNGVGENKLGKTLMQIRDEIRKQGTADGTEENWV